MIRIAVVSTICPYPKNVGKNVIWGGIIDFLRARSDVQLKIFTFEIFPEEEKVDTVLISRPSTRQILFNLVFKTFLARKLSIQESFFHSPSVGREMAASLEEFHPDMVIFDTIRTEQYSPNVVTEKSAVITYLDDLFSVRYRRVLAITEQGVAADKFVLGNFVNKIPVFGRVLFERSRWLRKLIIKFEIGALERSEQRAIRRSTASLLISPVEVDFAKHKNPRSEILEIPPGMVRCNRPRTWSGSPEFIFLGSLNIAHNITAVEWFLEECFPLVLKRCPRTTLKIIGKGGSSKLNELIKAYAHSVEHLGFVPEIEPYLLNACGLVSPLSFGSGIKIKAIDALRCGLPIVSTGVGAEGLHGVQEGAIFVSDNKEQFVESMISLIDPALNNRASVAANDVFNRYYSVETTDLIYSEIIKIKKSK
ncbi:glycosyltransferase [uncultured Pseudacidovorax sp.]|uniref:glycosyltransferase family 4 protein n=1 Tax=uncultured Pseudacidovorax sp. TaxID=679313 RepID=UPI0025F08DCC|nr:glycosyltransferase [uncultured Pseudacidovorax sp.]